MRLTPYIRINRNVLPLAILACGVVFFGMTPSSFGADLSGTWSGTWESGTKNHCGPLRATFCQTDEDHYKVRFSGRFWKVIPFRYSVTLDVVKRDGDKIFLSGSQKLLFFGTFCYEAEADSCTFTATYTANRDHGVFSLTRTWH
jgi:hypothetical protein